MDKEVDKEDDNQYQHVIYLYLQNRYQNKYILKYKNKIGIKYYHFNLKIFRNVTLINNHYRNQLLK